MSDYIYGSSLRAAKSKANYLFEGDFRRRPNQNLSGASRSVTGIELLQQAAEQRQNREDTRRKDIASLKIQSVWRGHCVRKTSRQLMRQNFDSIVANLDGNATQRVTRRSTSKNKPFTSEIYENLSREFIIHHKSGEDDSRYDSLIDLMMKYPEQILVSKQKDSGLWLNRLCKLMKINLVSIKRHLNSADISCIGKYLDFMEYYTRTDSAHNSMRLNNFEASKIWQSLIDLDLFKILRQLADQILCSSRSPNSSRDTQEKLILEIIRRSLDVEPFVIDGNSRGGGSSSSTMMLACRLFDQFFHGPFKPDLETSFFLELLKLRPKQLQPKELLQAFVDSLRLVNNSFRPPGSSGNIAFRVAGATVSPFSNQIEAVEHCKDTIWLCYLFLKALHTQIDQFSESEKVNYINVISLLIAPAEYITNISLIQASNEDPDDQNDEDPTGEDLSSGNPSIKYHQLTQYHTETHNVISKIIDLINKLPHINNLKSIIFNPNDQIQSQVQGAIVQICNLMLSHEYLAIFNCRLLYTIAFSKDFSRSLWRSIVTSASATIYGTSIPIHQQISRGNNISHESWRLILPKLKLFCCLSSYLLPTLGDEEFYTTNQNHSVLDDVSSSDVQMYNIEEDQSMLTDVDNTTAHQPGNSNAPNATTSSTNSSGISGFYVDKELIGISATLRDICIGLIEIIYQGNRHHSSGVTAAAQQFPNKFDIQMATSSFQDERSRLLLFDIKSCFQALVRLVCQLHARDSRKQFCPDGHWICPSVVIPANKAIDFQMVTSQQGRLLRQITKYEQTHQDRLASISSEIKTVLILQEIPFVISFHDRVQIFHQLLKKERQIHQPEGYHFGQAGAAISVHVRRNYIYEDAFVELSFDNEPNMKLPLKVSLVNAVGAEEAGIDGGGVTKEFLSELLKTGFDPMRGFFKCTQDNFLYPNPSASVLFAYSFEPYEVHYEFLGRILGKAIFEKIMVDLPLASFFLAKLLAVKHSSDVDLHNLESLDPVLYKNLVYLKNYKGDVADLDLDFTISNNELGEHEVIELKPGGSKIPVTRENKIEYVHLVADYRLNKQIRTQCAAFKRGLAQLIDLDWLRMFDPRELQILISGAPTVIDVADWKRNTIYGNGYTASSEAVQTFWTVVQQLDESRKRKLLKFATSCSLPPLLGFKDLVPQFAIAPAEGARLPTASTCMNLLKLPDCEDEETMRSKLLYAIESNSGFELS